MIGTVVGGGGGGAICSLGHGLFAKSMVIFLQLR